MKLTREANQAARLIAQYYKEETGRDLDLVTSILCAQVVQAAMDGDHVEIENQLSDNTEHRRGD